MDGYSSVQIINIMDKIEKEANKANGLNRRCAVCPLNTRPKTKCTEEIWLVCRECHHKIHADLMTHSKKAVRENNKRKTDQFFKRYFDE